MNDSSKCQEDLDHIAEIENAKGRHFELPRDVGGSNARLLNELLPPQFGLFGEAFEANRVGCEWRSTTVQYTDLVCRTRTNLVSEN
jgi:hypothetical protein